jgi:hypothetical protein
MRNKDQEVEIERVGEVEIDGANQKLGEVGKGIEPPEKGYRYVGSFAIHIFQSQDGITCQVYTHNYFVYPTTEDVLRHSLACMTRYVNDFINQFKTDAPSRHH